MLSTRKAPRSSTVHLRAFAAAALALGLVLTLAASAAGAPSLSIDAGPSGPTHEAIPLFGFATDLDATTECSIVPDQAAPIYVPCSGTYAPDTSLGEGDYVFWVRATNSLFEQAEQSRVFSVDLTPPSLSIDSGPSGATRVVTPSFGFTAELGATLQCSIDTGTPVYSPCSSPYTSVPLADGSYTFHVRATDAADNEATLARAFSVDATPPSVSIDSGPAGPTNDSTPSFGFTVDGSATTVQCSIDSGTAVYGACSGAGTHEPAAPLSDGSYVFRVRASDGLGNETVRTRSFAIDSAAPSLSIDSGPAGPTNDATPSFGFTAEAGTTVTCSIDTGMAVYGSCTSATTHVVGAALSDGTYTFRVRAVKPVVGNEAIVARTFTVDTTPPALSIAFGPSGTTSDSTPLFGFTAEAGATVACSLDQGTPAYGACTSASSHAPIAPLADGAYSFRVRATDAAGNEATLMRAFTVNTAPQTPPPADPRTDPTPPVTPTPSSPRLMSPFPLVRISGTLTSRGARIRLLSVRAPRGALVRITVSPACGGKRHAPRRCRVVRAAGTVGRADLIGFRGLARAYRSGTVIVVRVWSTNRIGKYTRFTIVRGKAPRRVDQCLMPGATRGSRCPSE